MTREAEVGLRVFGYFACGTITGVVFAGLLLLKLRLIPNIGEQTEMTFAELAALILAVATLVVAVILPSFGYFAFILAKREAIEAAKAAARQELKPDGEIYAAVRDEVLNTINEENGSLKLYIAELVASEVERRNSKDENLDEYGEPMKDGS